MNIFSNSLKYIISFVLPIFILFNTYALFVYNGGNDFFFGASFDNWRHSYLGLTGIYNFWGDALDTDLYGEFITELRNTINILSFNVNDLINGFTTTSKNIITILTSFFKWFGQALIQPFRLIFQFIKFIVVLVKFILNFLSVLASLFAGYYNTPMNSETIYHVSDYVYTM